MTETKYAAWDTSNVEEARREAAFAVTEAIGRGDILTVTRVPEQDFNGAHNREGVYISYDHSVHEVTYGEMLDQINAALSR